MKLADTLNTFAAKLVAVTALSLAPSFSASQGILPAISVSPTFNACAYVDEHRVIRNKDPFGTHEGPRLKIPKTQRSERSVFQRFYKPKPA